MNVVKINPEQTKRARHLIGEAGIFKALVLQPGVTTSGEGAVFMCGEVLLTRTWCC